MCKQAWMFAELPHVAVTRGCKQVYSPVTEMWWDLLPCDLRESNENTEILRESDEITIVKIFFKLQFYYKKSKIQGRKGVKI